MTMRVTEGARRESACTPLTKSEEKGRLLPVYTISSFSLSI